MLEVRNINDIVDKQTWISSCCNVFFIPPINIIICMVNLANIRKVFFRSYTGWLDQKRCDEHLI